MYLPLETKSSFYLSFESLQQIGHIQLDLYFFVYFFVYDYETTLIFHVNNGRLYSISFQDQYHQEEE